jgi:hypothetical protein
MFQIKVVEKVKVHILCSVTFSDSRAVYEIVWKNVLGSEAAHDNMAARCFLD